MAMAESKTKRSDANRKADRKYNQKRKTFALVYNPTDILDGLRLQKYLDSIDISCNQYLKNLVKKDLDSKKIPYPGE